MKKYILFTVILLAGLFCGGCLDKKQEPNDLETIIQRGYLIAGVKEDSPPFGFYKNNKLQGIDIDIARNIAKNIFGSDNPQNIKFVKVNTQNRISKLNSKEVDILVATMTINEKRKLVINFSNPYFVTSQKLMVRKDSKITHINYFNTSGKLGVVLGTTGERLIRLMAPTARIVGARSYKEATKLLEEGQVDGVVGDDCILRGYLSTKVKIINKSYSRDFYAVALRKSDKSKELMDSVNSSISAIQDEKKSKNIKKDL